MTHANIYGVGNVDECCISLSTNSFLEVSCIDMFVCCWSHFQNKRCFVVSHAGSVCVLADLAAWRFQLQSVQTRLIEVSYFHSAKGVLPRLSRISA